MTAEALLYARWLLSDAPSQVWQRASFAATTGDRRPLRWMAKQLRIDANDARAWFALAGFAPMQLEGKWHIGAAVPAPDPFDPDSGPGDDIILIDPEANTASVLGDPAPTIIAPQPQPDTIHVHTDPMKWLRSWADERVIFLETRRDAITRGRIVPKFSGEPPAALAIGPVAEVPWHRLYARTIRTDFEHAKAIKRAIFRAANLPSVEAA